MNLLDFDGILKYETVEEMLTPGMNGHGLGPGVGNDTFGHGGADEGFRAQLTAWNDLPHAVVIMVNSDNGQIMREVMLSVAKEYDLPGIEPRVKKMVAKSEEELMQYIGIFEIDDLGTLEISILNNHLTVEADFIDETIHLYAENDTLFFDRSDGTPIDFNIEEGVVTGFNVQGLQALRVED